MAHRSHVPPAVNPRAVPLPGAAGPSQPAGVLGKTTAGCAAATQAGDGPVAAGREHGLRAALSIAFLALRNSRTLLEQPGVSRALQAAPHADQLALRLVRAEADVALELVAPVLLATRPRAPGVVELAAAGLDHQAERC